MRPHNHQAGAQGNSQMRTNRRDGGSGWEAFEREQEIALLEAEAEGSAALRPAPKPVRREPRGTDPSPWVIVLAGGEGSRVRAFTTLEDGVAVPKQFCHFRDERTLLGTTLARALRLAPRERVVVVVVEAHRRWWEPELAELPAANVLSQPANRGTGVAILQALVHISRADPSARLVVMPSDHDFDDEGLLLRYVGCAAETAGLYPASLVLLGIAPSHLDAEYGLIVPGPGARHASRTVREFVEKPTLTAAAHLSRAGALWNSFIFASTGAALADVFRSALPSPVLSGLERAARGERDAAAMAAACERLPGCDFSRDILQRNAGRLRLIEVPNCGWTDLGTPARLAAWLEGHREALFWREHDIPRRSGADGLWGALQAGGA